MNESNVVYAKGQDSGPRRESAQRILRERIAELRRRADEYEALLKAIGEGESPAEAALWAVLLRERHGGPF